jgi:hypothetical protein
MPVGAGVKGDVLDALGALDKVCSFSSLAFWSLKGLNP